MLLCNYDGCAELEEGSPKLRLEESKILSQLRSKKNCNVLLSVCLILFHFDYILGVTIWNGM